MIQLANTQEWTAPPPEDAPYVPRLDPAELLVNEAHHRIKNSLQLVAAMLHLQARRHLDVPVLHDGLIQASRRVRAVAQVHERLHRHDGGELEAGAYLHDLCANLSRSLGLPTSRAVVVEASHVPLQPNRILGLGLIVTELVTNAVKHGITPYGMGEVRVVLAPGPDNTLRLLVADTGPGLPDSVLRGSAGGLGIRLVHHLTRTLGGRLEIDGTPPGARFTVRLAMESGNGDGRDTARNGEQCA
ncbi:sensor histidine kinase [Paracraurococcus lichenis]|uniref:histidine kinase n=1 Tax=Paracraurococcus lichenis TaxID=3064888 RepID=A0ABT9E6V2_9PROT|nr:sensor histidine kinase [Paracraurococcus sp. LOR1-02]MDO9711904.1 sensor histidine kinase [Paracraurococcus sp. LOR1-02]